MVKTPEAQQLTNSILPQIWVKVTFLTIFLGLLLSRFFRFSRTLIVR